MRPAAAEPPPAAAAAPHVRRIAIVDGGSFVLPYVFGLAQALCRRGHHVTVYASRTRYNGEFLEALRSHPGIAVVDAAVSGSVAPRWRGVPAYAGLLLALWKRRAQYDTVNLQFPVLWPVELWLWRLLGRRFVFTVHNAVPHGLAGRRHRGTERTARCARALVFPSRHTRDDFLRRYGDAWAARSAVLPHGLLPLSPEAAVVPYRVPERIEALVYWSTVKPYKGVELFAGLARSPALRERGLALEVHGRWSADLQDLKRELLGLGVTVEDRYLSSAELGALLARPVLFVLPYREATQSGALYTLLHHGCHFICADTGDLGDFMRRFGLDALLMADRSPEALLAAVDRWLAGRHQWNRAFDAAQRQSGWDAALADAASVYDAAP